MLTDVVDRTVVAAQQQKGTGRIERKYRNEILYLPVLRHRMPNADLAGRRQRNQLAANEEQILHAHMQIKRAHLGLAAVLRDSPQPNLAAVRDCYHLAVRLFARRSGQIHLRVDCDPLDRSFDVRRHEDLLPAGIILQPIARHEVCVRYGDPVVVRLDDLHPHRIGPARARSTGAKEQAHLVPYVFVQVDG